MTAVVRDDRNVTHQAIRIPYEEDEPDGPPVIGALCEATINGLLSGRYTAWTIDEVGEGQPDCMSCLTKGDQENPDADNA